MEKGKSKILEEYKLPVQEKDGFMLNKLMKTSCDVEQMGNMHKNVHI